MKKQTAVEWLFEQYVNQCLITLKDVQKAKEIEREQIINAYIQGYEKGEMFNNENRAYTTDANQYYTETFNQ
jgi:hypothetical protein